MWVFYALKFISGFFGFLMKLFISDAIKCYKDILEDIYLFFSRKKTDVEVFFDTIKTAIFWGWNLRHDRNWDHCYVWKMLSIKYRRMYTSMVKNGHLEWNNNPDSKDMRRLLIVCNLTKRIASEEYDDIAGVYDILSEYKQRLKKENKIQDRKYVNGMVLFPRTPMTKSEWARLKVAQKKAENLRKADIELCFKLIRKHGDGWWD